MRKIPLRDEIRIFLESENEDTFMMNRNSTEAELSRIHIGYGMNSMKKIVEKYGGSVMAGKANNWFELKILIPMKH